MTALRCPVCKRLSPSGSIRCDCGYNFESLEAGEAHVAAQLRRLRSQHRIGTGLAVVIGAPGLCFVVAAVLFAIGFPGLIAFLLPVAIVSELAGCYYTVSGLVEHRRAGRMMHAARELTQLPPARVIE